MGNRALIDTNILIDYILMRKPFFDDANEIFFLCSEEKINGCIAAHSIPNLYYILRKDFDKSQRRDILISLFDVFDVVGIDKNKLIVCLENDDFSDYEDCLQMECAKEYGAQYIITRNVSDFSKSEIPAVMPKDFLNLFDN